MTRLRYILPALTLVAALLPVASATAATPGVNVSNVSYQGDPFVGYPDPAEAARTWQDLTDSGAEQVRTFVRWHSLTGASRELEMAKWRQFVDKARARGLTVLLTVTGDPSTMATPAEYARAAADLASNLRGKVAGYEVWNEPDDNVFWRDGPKPADYAALIKAAYPAIKAADPDAKVLVGGLVANDFDFVEDLYDNGAQGSFDAVGIHTDTACLTTDPREYYREPSGRIGRYSFTGYREVRRSMLAHGDDKPIWMSELGWSTSGKVCAVGERAGTKPAGVSREVQADFLTKAYGCLANDPYVERADWFNLHDVVAAEGDDIGLITSDFFRKPAFSAFQAAASVAPIACGGTVDSSAPTVRFAKPTEGQRYLDTLTVEIRADDDKRVKDIDLFIDGHEIGPGGTEFSGTSAHAIKVWGGAANLSYGPHTLVARARDEAQNVSTARVTVVHIGGGNYQPRIRTKVKLRVGKIANGKVHVRAKVVTKLKVGKVAGVVSLYFERFDGRRWLRFGLYRRNARKPIHVTHRVSQRGKWRVRAKYTPKSSIKGLRASKAKASLKY